MEKANILFVRTETKGTVYEFGRDGNFIIKSNYCVNIRPELDFMLEDVEKFINKFFQVSYAKKAQDGFFFRFTNDKDEFRKIHDRKYTQSINHTENRFERGISVSCDMSYLAIGAYDYFYIVSGKVIGRGSDGEPLLDAKTMQKHSPYKSISSYCEKAQKKQKEKEVKFLKDYGWEVEQLRYLMYMPSACKMQYIGEDGEITDFSPWGNYEQKIFKEGEFEKWQKKLIRL